MSDTYAARFDQHIGGARGISLRNFGNTPALREVAQEYISEYAVREKVSG